MADIRVLRTAQELSAIVPAWEDLAGHALEPNAFYEPWMLLPALEHLDDGGAGLRCVTVWLEEGGGSRLCGLFPFHSPRRFKGLPVAAMGSYRHRHWLLATPLVRAGREAACFAALFDWLAKDGEGASLLEFRYVPCDGPVYAAIADALHSRDMMVLATDGFSRALLTKGDGHAVEVPHGIAKELRRKERRLAERGRVQQRVLRLEGEVQRWIDEFLRLEASGWKGRRGTALACREGDRRFAAEAMSAAWHRGQLMMVGVDLETRPLARCCNFVSGEGAFAFRTAFDESFGAYSPGVMAEVASVRQFQAQQRLRWMDSLTDPANELLNRLYNGRRRFQSLMVASGALAELALSGLPLLRWAKRRIAGAPSRAPYAGTAEGLRAPRALPRISEAGRGNPLREL